MTNIKKTIESPDKAAGILLLLASLAILASWYILLFVAAPNNITPIESAMNLLQYLYSVQNPSRLWFIWFAMLPIFCIFIGVSYLINFAESKKGSVILFTLSCSLGVSVLLLHRWEFAAFILMASIFGARCIRR